MTVLDAVLLAAMLLVAGGWALVPERGRRVLRVATLVLVMLGAAQFASEGFYWQLLPGYMLILVAGALAMRPPRSFGWRRRLRQLGLVVLMGAAAAPWMLFLPVP